MTPLTIEPDELLIGLFMLTVAESQVDIGLRCVEQYRAACKRGDTDAVVKWERRFKLLTAELEGEET